MYWELDRVPCIFFPFSFAVRWSLSWLLLDGSWGEAWTGCQSITQLTHTDRQPVVRRPNATENVQNNFTVNKTRTFCSSVLVWSSRCVIMLIRWCLADIHFPALAILSYIQLSLKEKSETDPLKLLFRLTHGDKWKAPTLLSAFSRVLNWSQSQCNPGNCIWEHIFLSCLLKLNVIYLYLLSLSSLVTPNTLFNSSPAD